MMVPGRELTVPNLSHGATCRPNTASAERSAADDASIFCAPAPPSSAGWNTKRAVPRSWDSRACCVTRVPPCAALRLGLTTGFTTGVTRFQSNSAIGGPNPFLLEFTKQPLPR